MKNTTFNFVKLLDEVGTTTSMTIDSLTNAQLAHNMRYGMMRIESNVFYTIVDMTEIREDSYPQYGFPVADMLMLAKARYNEKKSPGNQIASLLHECAKATLLPEKIVLSMPEVKECVRFKGTYLPAPIAIAQKNRVRDEDYVRPIMTLYRPILDNVTQKMQAVIADATGEIFPRVVVGPPPDLTRMYAGYKNVTDCVTHFAADAIEGTIYKGNLKGKAANVAIKGAAANRVALTSIYNKIWVRNYHDLHLTHAQRTVKTYTKMSRDEPTPEYVQVLAEYGVKVDFQPDYSNVPAPVGKYAINESLAYMLKSRAVRGEQNGIARLTTNYFYGDIPVHLYRSVNLAHSIQHIFQSLEGMKLDGVFLYDNAFKNIELVGLNVPLYGTTKGLALKENLRLLVLDSINRTVSRSKKGVLSYDKTFSEFEVTMRERESRLREVFSRQGITMIYVVQSLVCDGMFNTKATVLRTMHAHSARVWYVPSYERIAPKKLNPAQRKESDLKLQASKDEIAHYIVAANIHKNYYPFHRTPLFTQKNYRGSIVLVDRKVKQVYTEAGLMQMQTIEVNADCGYEYEKRIQVPEEESRAEQFPCEQTNYVDLLNSIGIMDLAPAPSPAPSGAVVEDADDEEPMLNLDDREFG